MAVTKHQSPSSRFFLGDLISGTYCSRIFSDCDRNECRLQSPNFPGLYPRNLTCYYAVRQHPVPPNKHALISIKQKNGQLLSIQSIQYSENKHETKLKVGFSWILQSKGFCIWRSNLRYWTNKL